MRAIRLNRGDKFRSADNFRKRNQQVFSKFFDKITSRARADQTQEKQQFGQ